MKAMILAAGKGQRMRPLTLHTPKPLLKAGAHSLIERQISLLVAAGYHELVINHHWLGEQIIAALGDGHQLGAQISYSAEEQALETGGGIQRALPLLGSQPFVVVNADIWTDYDYQQLGQQPASGRLAHLVMVDNPPHNPAGDFALEHGLLSPLGSNKLTYSGIAVLHPQLFANCAPGVLRLADLLLPAMAQGLVSGEHFGGRWLDVGTVERLEQANQMAQIP